MPDIEPLHRIAYEAGVDPIEHAVFLIGLQVVARDEVLTARLVDPGAFPIVKDGLSVEALSRRALASLLDAGWAPPETTSAT